MLIFILLPILIKTCKSQLDCPYSTISNFEEITQSTKDGYRFKINFSGLINLYFKKKEIAKLDSKVENLLDDYFKQSTIKRNFNKDKFVNEWNTLVVDICGKISIYNQLEISPNNKIKLEEAILERVINFYETLKIMDTVYVVEKPENIDEILNIAEDYDNIDYKQPEEIIEYVEKLVIVNNTMFNGKIYLEDKDEIFLGYIKKNVNKFNIPVQNGVKILRIEKGNLKWETHIDFKNKNKNIIFSSKSLVK